MIKIEKWFYWRNHKKWYRFNGAEIFLNFDIASKHNSNISNSKLTCCWWSFIPKCELVENMVTWNIFKVTSKFLCHDVWRHQNENLSSCTQKLLTKSLTPNAPGYTSKHFSWSMAVAYKSHPVLRWYRISLRIAQQSSLWTLEKITWTELLSFKYDFRPRLYSLLRVCQNMFT